MLEGKEMKKRIYTRGFALAFVMVLLTNTAALRLVKAEEEGTGPSITVDKTNENVAAVESLAGTMYSNNVNTIVTQVGPFVWETENRKDKSWTYYTGIMMDAFLMMDSSRFFSSINAFYDYNMIASTKA